VSYSTIQERITGSLATLTPSQREMAEYVLANPLRIVSMPINELSEQTGFSVSSATRFAAALGFASYAEFRSDLARSLEAVMAPISRREATPARVAGTAHEYFQRSLEEDIRHLEETRHSLDAASCERAVRKVVKARRVFAYGAGQSAYLAAMFANELSAAGVDAPLIADAGGGFMAADRLRFADKRDVAVLIGFPRYARDTVAMAHRIALRHVPIIAVTDGPKSPLAPLAEVLLFARSDRAEGKLTSKAVELALLEAFTSAILAKLGTGTAALIEQSDFGMPWLHDSRDAAAPSPSKTRPTKS